MLEGLIKSAGISRKAICEKMGVCYPTLHRYLDNPADLQLARARQLMDALPEREREALREYFISFFER